MMENIKNLPGIVRQNIRDFRLGAGLRHVDVATALAVLIGSGTTASQSQCNERAEGLPYRRLAALAEVFETEVWQFFVTDPPGLEDYRKKVLTSKGE